MELYQRLDFDTFKVEHEQRMREAEGYRRAREARRPGRPSAAAPAERRFFIFRLFAPSRPVEA